MRLSGFRNFLIKAISTFFFVGYLPLIPGTFGSLAGVGIIYLLKNTGGWEYLLVILAVVVLGLLSCGRMEKLLNKKDPGCIVIDEVAGMLIAFSFIPLDLKIVILGFLIFRILDTLKPYPAARLQNLHGAVGIIGDDLVAGIYTNIVLQVVLKFASFKIV